MDLVADGRREGAAAIEPSSKLSTTDVVTLLMGALKKNDDPAPDNGLKTILRFTSPTNPIKSLPEETFFNQMKNTKYK